MGAAASQPEPEPPAWDGSEMPSQQGKVAIVTGANSGIGYFTARALAAKGAHVILACRDETKARAAETEMAAFLSDHGATGSVEFIQVDVGELASVRAFAETIRSRFERIDLLVNNAGVVKPMPETTQAGLEGHFAINYLGHFYLTALLFELLRKSPAARVVHIGSSSHGWKPLRDETHLQANNWWWWDRYGQSKLAQMLFMVELQRRLDAAQITNVVSLAAHPGVAYTGLNDKVVESMYPPWLHGINKKISSWLPLQPAHMGALPSLYAATFPELCGQAYIGPSGAQRMSGFPSADTLATYALDEAAATRLWAFSEKLTGARFEIK